PSRTILRAKDLRLVGETDLLEALALGHYAIVKRNVGGTAAQFSHHKRRGRFLRDIESLAVTVGGEEHAIVHVRVNGLSENLFEVNNGLSAGELSAARILKPVFRPLDGVESNLARSAVHRDHGGLRAGAS